MAFADAIIQVFNGNKFVIDLNVEGLSHADSLLQPPAGANCLNWILGHILAHRNLILELLDEAPIWDEAQVQRYKYGSDAVTADRADVVRLETMLADLDVSQVRLLAALGRIDDAALAQAAGDSTVGQRVLGLAWHETYHAGQCDFLRRLAGKLEGGIR